jgi:dTDP-4-dehydrorhamnose reductase
MIGEGRPRILLTGGSGQIGWEMRRALAPLGAVAAPDRARLDLTDTAALQTAVRDLAPAAIVNCAAYTDVEGAEREEAAARVLNVGVPEVLAAEAARAGALMVHFSTDYVFDGRKRAPYTEEDSTSALNTYGRTKVEGEEAVAAAGGPHLVFRTSWVYGRRGRNFLQTILRLARERDEIPVVDDQVGAPTWSRLVAEAVAVVIGRLAGGGRFGAAEGPWGTYHLSAAGATSWHGFAERILAEYPLPDGRSPRILPVSTAAYGAGAVRPAYSVLDCGRAEGAFAVRLPDWREQLALAVAS